MAKKTRIHGHGIRHLPVPRNYCFACGPDNPDGMHLKFDYVRRRRRFVSRFRLGRRYTGPPGHAHGGIIATILDEAMGKVNKLRSVIALTSRIEVQYLKPVPLDRPLRVESWELRVRGRQHTNVAEILDGRGQVLARSKALFLAIDPLKMFARHLPNGWVRRAGVK
jgi:uncharacterized protein (TIGR00369 family)